MYYVGLDKVLRADKLLLKQVLAEALYFSINFYYTPGVL